ncbi:MAG: site-specific integrase [Candidatus Solibacter sp.]|nr:site-specific integrase [Candidatus Solibacter sp.]
MSWSRPVPPVAAALPTSLAGLLAEFMKQYAQETLAAKTVERYHEMIPYLSPELPAMDMSAITPLHLTREWARLLKEGGHARKTKTPRPMAPKTVRNIAGLVSSAYLRAIKWSLVTTNPVTHSDLPKVKKRAGLALLPSEQDQMVTCAVGPWCILELAAATGCRRGEVLALRWCDIRNDAAIVDRSLCQTRDGISFKSTKTETPRRIELPPATMPLLARHRKRQEEFRRQYGPGYRNDLDLIIANSDGTPLMPDSVSATVSRLCRMLKLPKGASLHTVRHSHASLLLEKGVDIANVSERLGHSSVATTAAIYSHAIRGKDRAAAQVWDDLMQQARGEKSAGVN